MRAGTMPAPMTGPGGAVGHGALTAWRYSLPQLAVFTLLFGMLGGQQQSAIAGCSLGPPGPTKTLSALSVQQLADGALATSVQTSWDFEGRGGVLQAVAGRNVSLACLTAVNAIVSAPSGSPAFLQPTAIGLTNAAGFVMESVSLSTHCRTVLEYQEYFCSSYRVAGSLTLEQGVVHFSSWQDSRTSLRNVTLTCPSPETASQPPCRLVAVQTPQQMLEAFTTYAPASQENLTIVVAANISISKGIWPSAPVVVTNNVTFIGSSLLQRPVLDFNLMVGLWELTPGVNVLLVDLTCANLAPTYLSPQYASSTFALLTERVWAFQRYGVQVHIVSSTLVVPAEELAYTKYWITFLVSPVPEAQARAAWLSVIDIKVLAVNKTGVYYDAVRSFTATYSNVHLTSTLGAGYALLSAANGLSQLQADNVPLTAVRQVIDASDLMFALAPDNSQPDEQGRRWLLLVANISITDGFAWPQAPDGGGISSSGYAQGAVQLPGNMVVGLGSGLQSARLSLGGRVNAMGVPDSATFVLRRLMLSDLAVRSTVYAPQDPLAILASPLWGLALTGSYSRIRLENSTVLVSAIELLLLQQCLLPAQARPGGRSFDAALVSAVTSFYTTEDTLRITSHNSTHFTVATGVTSRFSMLGVTFRTPVAVDGEGAAADFAVPEAVPEDSGGGSLDAWQVGLIVGCVVGGSLVVAFVALLLFARHRRRQSAERANPAEGAYAKYLRSSAEQTGRQQAGGGGDGPSGGGGRGGGEGGGGSDLVNPSQELTNSSQVLRPGARNSDVEGGAAARLKMGGSGTASASGGLGAAGRSMSITHDTISGAGLASASGVAAPRGVSTSGSAGERSAGTTVTAAASSLPQGQSQTTDSFERPPSNTALGQHGPAGRDTYRHASMVSVVGASATTTTGGTLAHSHSALSTGGGTGLEQLHQMIQVLGRDFNDRQLEVHNLLGKGAHGTVYRGTWRCLPVAVKSMIFSSENNARQQHRPLMEAAISSNLAHPNIVTTYSYEIREVQHELASISPELAQQGGGWRLLIIQEFCDAGPLRRIVDCGFFLTPPKPSGTRAKLKRATVGLLRKDSPSGAAATEGSVGAAPRGEPSAASQPTASCSRGSSGSSSVNGNGSRGSPGNGAAGSSSAQASAALTQHPLQRPALEDVPDDVPPRPTSCLQAALRYVDAALMISRGLQHIHEKNIVHGDLNPNNVLLMRAPDSPLGFCLKVADFGLSIRMAEGESHMSNLFQGSPYYCAPEVVLSGKIGKSADIYSLGIMLWELQNGTRPLWRMGVRLRTYPSLNTGELDFGSDTPPRFVRLARDCFHGSKDARPSISSVVETLVGIKNDLGSLLRA